MVAHTTPPGPSGPALARGLAEYGRDPIAVFARLARQHGDIARLAGPPINTYLVNRPEYIEDVLVTRNWSFIPVRPFSFSRAFHQSTASTDGYFHLRHRRTVEPMLYRDQVPRWAGWVSGRGTEARGRWREGAVVDLEQEMAHLTATVMGELFFGADSRADPRELRAVHVATEYLATRSTHPLGTLAEALPLLPENRRFWAAIDFLDRMLRQRIRTRRAAGEDRGDLLSLLLSVRDPVDGHGWNDRQIRDELISIYMIPSILMGRALTWTWYLLAQHPAVEATLHAEVDAVLGGRLPEAADWPRLVYTEMVIAESMRLYPPSWIVARRAVQDFEIDGYTLPAGAVVALCAAVTQHDPRYFPDPSRFDPERWTAEARSARPSCSYFPFSGGPRNCLGQHFARMAMVLLLATLAQRWRPRLLSRDPVQPQARFALRPKHGLQMRLEERVGV